MYLAYSFRDILLKEVSTEGEAFAEMRRFLEVNHIVSNETTVEPFADHKKVTMGATFVIYYDEKPSHMELGTEKQWGISRKPFTAEYEICHHYNPAINERVCWYDEVKAYLDDLKRRNGG